MKTITVLFTVLASLTTIGCMDEADKTDININGGCGPKPQRPGYAVGFEDINGMPRATLNVDTWLSLEDWMNQSSDWSFCVEQHLNNLIK